MAGTAGTKELATRLPPSPESIRDARRFAADAVLRLGATEDDAEVARLLVSELATNVVLHARTPMDIRVARLNGAVEVEVADQAPDRGVRQGPKRTAVGGRGIVLVDSFADEWGVDVRGDTKAVWFRLAG